MPEPTLRDLTETAYLDLCAMLDEVCKSVGLPGEAARLAKIRAIEKTLSDARVRQNGLPEWHTDTEGGAQILAHSRRQTPTIGRLYSARRRFVRGDGTCSCGHSLSDHCKKPCCDRHCLRCKCEHFQTKSAVSIRPRKGQNG